MKYVVTKKDEICGNHRIKYVVITKDEKADEYVPRNLFSRFKDCIYGDSKYSDRFTLDSHSQYIAFVLQLYSNYIQ